MYGDIAKIYKSISIEKQSEYFEKEKRIKSILDCSQQKKGRGLYLSVEFREDSARLLPVGLVLLPRMSSVDWSLLLMTAARCDVGVKKS